MTREQKLAAHRSLETYRNQIRQAEMTLDGNRYRSEPMLRHQAENFVDYLRARDFLDVRVEEAPAPDGDTRCHYAVVSAQRTYLNATHACQEWTISDKGEYQAERMTPVRFIRTLEINGRTAYQYLDLMPHYEPRQDKFIAFPDLYTYEPLPRWGVPCE